MPFPIVIPTVYFFLFRFKKSSQFFLDGPLRRASHQFIIKGDSVLGLHVEHMNSSAFDKLVSPQYFEANNI